MADSKFSSMAAMMGQKSGSTGVPTQGFNASNILGTPVPQVGDNKGRPNYAAAVGNSINNYHVVFIVIALIGIGYLLYHFNFEK